MSNLFFSFFNKKNISTGFTLIELMVSIGIMSILTTILFSNYPDSITRVGLANTSHKIAILIREAQVRGSSIDSRSGVNVISGYGVYASSTMTTSLIFFSDFPNNVTQANGIYLGDGLYANNEMVSTLKLLQDFYISNLCVKTGGVQSCISNSTNNIVNNLTVSFNRPNPRPNIYINNTNLMSYDEACIEIKSPKMAQAGYMRSIKVSNTGYITTSIIGCL